MGKALIIGCGGVASVTIHKCCQNSDVYEEIMIASRTKSKCDALKAKLEGTTKTKIHTAQVDADNVPELVELINGFNPDVVINLALPYQDLRLWMLVLKRRHIMWIQQITSHLIQRNSNINGNGLIVRNSKKRESALY